MPDIEQLLSRTPYLIPRDEASIRRFEAATARAEETRRSATAANRRIVAEAREALGPYLKAARTELVAESNTIEGLEWTVGQVREVVATHQELLSAPIRTFVESVKADSRLYETLGLYRAHEIAETWSSTERTPRAHEIRELHRLILGSVAGSGQFKVFDNAIGGSAHKTTSVADTPRVMLEYADWWEHSSSDPLMTATVAHAWLTHIHPFEDGNGRLSRILANLELGRHGFPALTVRAASDRGEYYTALASSDEGDILPLYELFGRVLRRQAKIMARPHYLRSVIANRLLSDERQRFQFWRTSLELLIGELERNLEPRGLRFELQGTLDPASFSLLCDRDVEGNGWFARIGRFPNVSEWLLWFGFRSQDWLDIDGSAIYPSIFISRRDRTPYAQHPYTAEFSERDLRGSLPSEICVVPAQAKPVRLRRGFDIEETGPEAAAMALADVLASGT